MYPEVRVCVIETAKQIIKDMGETLTPERVIEVTNQLIEGMGIPKIVTQTKSWELSNTYTKP